MKYKYDTQQNFNETDANGLKVFRFKKVIKILRKKIYLIMKEIELKLVNSKIHLIPSYVKNLKIKIKKLILDYELLLKLLKIILNDNKFQYKVWNINKLKNIYFKKIRINSSTYEKFNLIELKEENFRSMVIENYNLNFYNEELFIILIRYQNLTINYSIFSNNYDKAFLVSKKLLKIINKFKFSYSFKINYELSKSILNINKLNIILKKFDKFYDLSIYFFNINQFLLYVLKTGSVKNKKIIINILKFIWVFFFQLFFNFYKNKNLYKSYECLKESQFLINFLEENDFHMYINSLNDIFEENYGLEEEWIEFNEILLKNKYYNQTELDVNKKDKNNNVDFYLNKFCIKNNFIKTNKVNFNEKELKNKTEKINHIKSKRKIVSNRFLLNSERNIKKKTTFSTKSTTKSNKNFNPKKNQRKLKSIESNIYNDSPKLITSKNYFIKEKFIDKQFNKEKRKFIKNLNTIELKNKLKKENSKNLIIKDDLKVFENIINKSLNKNNIINEMDTVIKDTLFRKRLDNIDNIEFNNAKKLLLIKKNKLIKQFDTLNDIHKIKEEYELNDNIINTTLYNKKNTINNLGKKSNKKKPTLNWKRIILKNNQIFNLADTIYKKQKNLEKNVSLKERFFKKFTFNKEAEDKKLKLTFEKEINKYEKLIENKKDIVNNDTTNKLNINFIRNNQDLFKSIAKNKKYF